MNTFKIHEKKHSGEAYPSIVNRVDQGTLRGGIAEMAEDPFPEYERDRLVQICIDKK